MVTKRKVDDETPDEDASTAVEEPQEGALQVEQPPPTSEEGVVQPQRQMVPPSRTHQVRRSKGDPNWYPDPDKPLPKSP